MDNSMDGVPPEAWMRRLFARLHASYGSKMSAMWGDCPQADIIDAWRHGLKGVPAERIARALELMLTDHPEWPPTLGQFLALCRRPLLASASHVEALPAPRTEMPAHVKAQLMAFKAKVMAAA